MNESQNTATTAWEKAEAIRRELKKQHELDESCSRMSIWWGNGAQHLEIGIRSYHRGQPRFCELARVAINETRAAPNAPLNGEGENK